MGVSVRIDPSLALLTNGLNETLVRYGPSRGSYSAWRLS